MQLKKGDGSGCRRAGSYKWRGEIRARDGDDCRIQRSLLLVVECFACSHAQPQFLKLTFWRANLAVAVQPTTKGSWFLPVGQVYPVPFRA